MIVLPLNQNPPKDYSFNGYEVSVLGAPHLREQTSVPHYINSLYFDGVSDALEIPTSAIDVSGDFTISMRIKAEMFDSTRVFFYLWQSSTKYLSFYRRGASNTISLYSYDTTGTVQSQKGLVIKPNEWYHVCLTRQGDIWRIFVDGQLQNEVSFAYSITPTKVLIGASLHAAENWHGCLQEFFFTNECLYTESFTPTPILPKAIVGNTFDSNDASVQRRFYVFKRNAPFDMSQYRRIDTSSEGWFVEPMSNETVAVLKEAAASNENSQIFDYVVPIEYTPAKFKFESTYPTPLSWVESKPITIQMGYTTSVDCKIVSTTSTGFEFKINDGDWVTTDETIKDGDILRLRITMPSTHALETPVEGKIRIGPVIATLRTYLDVTGTPISIITIDMIMLQATSKPKLNYQINELVMQGVSKPKLTMNLNELVVQSVSKGILKYNLDVAMIQTVRKIT